jgi:hypothetical protein
MVSPQGGGYHPYRACFSSGSVYCNADRNVLSTFVQPVFFRKKINNKSHPERQQKKKQSHKG